MLTKPFKTIDEQIEILKSRNLTFLHEPSAKRILATVGYYELINGYKDIGIETGETFKDGFTFEQLFHVFNMDKEIRSAVNAAILEIEAHLRTALSYIVAKHYTADQNIYLNRENYERGDDKFQTSQRDKLLKKCHKIINDDSHPYKHYREKHGNVPPWILVKGMTFGNLIAFYKLQKSQVKAEIVSELTGIPVELVSDDFKSLIINILYFLLAYRNRCAHLGRVFNFETTKNKIHYNKLFHDRMKITESEYKQGKGQFGLATLVSALSWFSTTGEVYQVVTILNFKIQEAINNYLKLYPTDKDFIYNQLGGNLIPII
ncbi:TPA: Abi family protein [Streptococcus suis]